MARGGVYLEYVWIHVFSKVLQGAVVNDKMAVGSDFESQGLAYTRSTCQVNPSIKVLSIENIQVRFSIKVPIVHVAQSRCYTIHPSILILQTSLTRKRLLAS